MVSGVIVTGPKDAKIYDLLLQLSQKIADGLRTDGPKLVASDEAFADPLPALKARLATRKLPKVSVKVPERQYDAGCRHPHRPGGRNRN